MNNGKICVSVCAKTASELFEKIARAEPLADVIELRFDCLNPDEVESAINNLPATERTYVITYRPSEQGGLRVLPLNVRLMFWRKLLPLLAGRDILIDLEADVNFPLIFDETKVIRSAHFFNDPPTDLRPVFFALSDLSDGIVKIAATAKDIIETLPAWELIETSQREERRVIPIAMGEPGKWTRILSLAHGAFMTYAALDADEATAPGQITASDLVEVYRVKQISQATKVHGVIAGDTSYSVSPWMQNAAFKAAGEDRVFIPLQVTDLDAFIKRMVRSDSREIDLNFAGFSVTNPHKQAIIAHLDEIDETAKTVGAVNTVDFKDGKLYGYNTDALGFISPLTDAIGDVKGATVAVVGAGGAARACIYALTEAGAHVTLYARDLGKAQDLADRFSVQTGSLPNAFTGSDILVNCTPLGTKGKTEDQTIATADQLAGVKLVYDLVYNPVETRLIREARSTGVQTLGGLEMLIAQGAEQFKIWTGKAAPIDAMTTAVTKKLNL